MAALRVPVALNSLHLPESAPRFEATPVSWFTVERGEDGEVRLGQDEHQLRFLHMPQDLEDVHFDLNLSHPEDWGDLDDAVDVADHCVDPLDHLLALVENANCDLGDTDFVIFPRTLLVKLLMLPYLNSVPFPSGFVAYATKVGGTVFLSSGDTDRITARLAGQKQNYVDLRCKQGLKFQQYFLKRSPEGLPDPTLPYAESRCNIETMMKATLGTHRMLYCMEIKGIHSPGDLKDMSRAYFTDLRTNSRNSDDDIQWFKWLDFWGNYVVGRFNKVVVGYVSDAKEGVVRRLDVLEGEDMMRRCQESMAKCPTKFRQNPCPEVCFDFLDKLLEFLKSEMANAGLNEIYRLRWEKYKPAKLERVERCQKDLCGSKPS